VRGIPPAGAGHQGKQKRRKSARHDSRAACRPLGTRLSARKQVGHWNRFNRYSGGTLVEKCCHFFDLMRRIVRARPVRVIASGGQDVEYKAESYVEQDVGHLEPASQAAAAAEAPDILDNAYVIVEFENRARAMLDLCMFAENSVHQEEVSLVGAKGKIEAFGSKHGEKTEDGSIINFRLGLRAESSTWSPSRFLRLGLVVVLGPRA